MSIGCLRLEHPRTRLSSNEAIFGQLGSEMEVSWEAVNAPDQTHCLHDHLITYSINRIFNFELVSEVCLKNHSVSFI